MASKFSIETESAMKVLYATILYLVITVTEALAAGGGGSVKTLSLLTIFFLGFGALIIVFQLVPALILFGAMLKALCTSAVKKKSKV